MSVSGGGRGVSNVHIRRGREAVMSISGGGGEVRLVMSIPGGGGQLGVGLGWGGCQGLALIHYNRGHTKYIPGSPDRLYKT